MTQIEIVGLLDKPSEKSFAIVPFFYKNNNGEYRISTQDIDEASILEQDIELNYNSILWLDPVWTVKHDFEHNYNKIIFLGKEYKKLLLNTYTYLPQIFINSYKFSEKYKDYSYFEVTENEIYKLYFKQWIKSEIDVYQKLNLKNIFDKLFYNDFDLNDKNIQDILTLMKWSFPSNKYTKIAQLLLTENKEDFQKQLAWLNQIKD